MTKLFSLAVSAAALVSCSVAFSSDFDFRAHASLTGVQSFNTPEGRLNEICMLPQQRSELARYSKGDLKTEKNLCALDFYGRTSQSISDRPIQKMAICPKLHSTNPAVEIYEPVAGLSKEEFERTECRKHSRKRDKSKGKKIAKFKQSYSCSYTASMIGYYHLSRILGGAGLVPPAVVRTMDLVEHRKVAKLGRDRATAIFGGDDLATQIWRNFYSLDLKPTKSRKYSPKVYTDDFRQLYGAIIYNPKGEENYGAMTGGRSYSRFMGTPFFRRAASSKAIEALLPGNPWNNLQKLIEAKDASEIAIMDHIMSQQDRLYNIHYVEYFVYVEDGRLKKKRAKKSAQEALPPAVVASGQFVKVKMTVLKDNDCGVIKSNKTKEAGVVKKLRHVNLYTYQQVQRLAQAVDGTSTKDFFTTQSLMTSRDYRTFSKNVKEVASILKSNCQNGRLRLDLNPVKFLKGETVDSKSLCQ